MNKRKIIYKTILIFLFLIFCIIFALGQKYSKNEISFISKPVSYNSSIDAIKVPFEIKETKNKILKQDIEISFNFILDKISEHDNIFQTSDANQGLRMEFEKATGNLYLIAPSLFPNGEGFLIKKINPHEKYSFKLQKSKNKQIIITLNNEQIPINYTNDSFKMDNIVVGRGFSSDRKFYGTVKNFTAGYKYLTISKIGENGIYVLLILFMLLCVVTAMYYYSDITVFFALFIMLAVLLLTRKFWINIDFSVEYTAFISVSLSIYGLSYTLLSKFYDYIKKNNIKIVDILFILIIIVLMILPVTKISKDIYSISENREFAVYKPLISSEGINYNFGKDFDAWFSDRFFGRKLLLYINNSRLYYINKYFSSSQSFLNNTGSDAFLNKKTKESFLLPMNRSPKISQDSIDKSISLIKIFKDFCDKQNIKLYIILVPTKNSVYYDKAYPYNLLPFGNNNDSAIKEVARRTGVTIIHPKEKLISERQNYETYFRTDHHWTDRGAYIGYSALMEEITKDFPQQNIKTIPSSDFNIYSYKLVKAGGSAYYPGQMIYCMLNVPSRAVKNILTFDYDYLYHKDKNNMNMTSENLNRNRVYTYKNSTNDLKTMAIGTSMTENLMEIFPYSFKTTMFFRLGTILSLNKFRQIIQDEKPNILILCFEDDNIPSLANDIFGGF